MVGDYQRVKYINQYIYVYSNKDVKNMVSKTEVIILFMLKNSKKKDNRIFCNKLNYWYFLNETKDIILREGDTNITRASYYEINQLYKEFIEVDVKK